MYVMSLYGVWQWACLMRDGHDVAWWGKWEASCLCVGGNDRTSGACVTEGSRHDSMCDLRKISSLLSLSVW